MARNPSHQRKSKPHLAAYSREIRKQRYEPTVDESLNFRETSMPGEDLSEPVPEKRRPTNTKAQIEDYIRENWVPWAIGIMGVVAAFFFVDAKVNFSRLFDNDAHQEGRIQGTEHDISDIEKKNAEQDLAIQSNSIRLEYVEPKEEVEIQDQ